MGNQDRESYVNKELEYCNSKKIFEIIAKAKFGDGYEEEIKKIAINFSELKQEKFSADGLVNDTNFATQLGLTVESQVVQDDLYYGEKDDYNLKIRKTSGVNGAFFVAIYKKIDDNGKLNIIAFDVPKETSNEIRDRFKNIMHIRKTRTTYKSNLGVDVTCDSDVLFLADNRKYFRTSIPNLEKDQDIEVHKHDFKKEIWEIGCANNKLLEEYNKMKDKVLAYKDKNGKTLEPMGIEGYSDFIVNILPKTDFGMINSRI